MVGGFPAPLLFVSGQQINLQVRWEIAGSTADIVVAINGTALAPSVGAALLELRSRNVQELEVVQNPIERSTDLASCLCPPEAVRKTKRFSAGVMASIIQPVDPWNILRPLLLLLLEFCYSFWIASQGFFQGLRVSLSSFRWLCLHSC
jgi:hypothetical protein